MKLLRAVCAGLMLGAIGLAQGFVSEDVTFNSGSIQMAGTLTLPRTPGPHPALVLITGSGPQDRDEFIAVLPDYRPFKTIAEHLGGRGFAVLRYDDRGTAASKGDFASATSADFAQDAEAAFNYLLARREIDPQRVGLFGHSEGGIVAAMVAARNPKVAFVVSMAGTAVRGDQVLMEQAAQILRASKMPEPQIQDMLKQQKAQLELLASADWKALEAFTYGEILKQYRALPEAEQKKLGDLEAAAKAQTAQSMVLLKGWLHFFVTHDPAEDWARVRVPVLALFGGLDLQVLANQNRPPLLAALAKAGNTRATAVLFPKANHLFQQATTGSPEEYSKLSSQFVPGFLEAISEWLERNSRP